MPPRATTSVGLLVGLFFLLSGLEVNADPEAEAVERANPPVIG